MSPKELTYIEDALSHEKFLKTQCQEAITNLQDPELKSCVEQISQKHQQIFGRVSKLVDKNAKKENIQSPFMLKLS